MRREAVARLSAKTIGQSRQSGEPISERVRARPIVGPGGEPQKGAWRHGEGGAGGEGRFRLEDTGRGAGPQGRSGAGVIPAGYGCDGSGARNLIYAESSQKWLHDSDQPVRNAL
ncbi:hypothetical protein Y1Q_0007365 [Alligator mississippiensis]|uniref:Uncharacterized protein n=1 Tax=Alligator mississippiensis TaxID=8496 RepID=A0A151P834_ALLMI|nr:hypothetical protein Y1Q_0007365 [Alligator mississippiensis]